MAIARAVLGWPLPRWRGLRARWWGLSRRQRLSVISGAVPIATAVSSIRHILAPGLVGWRRRVRSLTAPRVKEPAARLADRWRGLSRRQRLSVISGAVPIATAVSSIRHILAPGLVGWRRRVRSLTAPRVKEPAARLADRWRGLSRLRRYLLAAAVVLAGIVISFGVLTWSGVSAALDARQAYRELEAELSHLTPVDLIQVNVYHSLEEKFQNAEEASARAQSRLGFLRAFQWLPVVGGRIKEARLLLEMAFYQGRAGRSLAGAYGAAISQPLEQMPLDLVVSPTGSDIPWW